MRNLHQRFALSFVLLLTACNHKSNLIEKLGGESVGIFSNRQVHQDQFIAIIKLKSPALLTTAQKVQGQNQVNANLAAQIEEEQKAAIEDLKSLSSDIRVLFRYRMVLNALAVVAPASVMDKLSSRLHVAYVEKESSFGRPAAVQNEASLSAAISTLAERNSVKFIGGEDAHAAGISGQGMKIGIIDTGIDYTHSMLGGVGTEEAYKAIDPSKPNSAFPNSKVVGGIDLAGTEYNTASGDASKHIPVPDENPLDEAGHGSHVAGTVAGFGDGVQTYSGVAPAASLYAIKVFGSGSTGDAVVIAGLEYAADPNRDGQIADQLDVVNLSLGSSFGNPHLLYGEAIGNLSKGGTVVVASAGNEGNFDYIVGAPSIADEAISVAASIDNADHNWKFDTIQFSSSLAQHVAEAIEGPISKPIKDAGPVTGKLVYAGLAKEDFSADLAASLKGQVALIDRGAVNFSEKIRRAQEAGAIGVVVANNQPGAPITMGGEGHFEIPAVMIPQDLGVTLKEEMKSTDVVIQFQGQQKVERPELIDTLTSFSSKGPRSIDGLLKPEISAPGYNVVSAEMGGGSKGVQMSGTSMAGPHIAGVMALLKQTHPDLTSAELKSILMGRAKSIADETKQNYLLSRQGAGRAQIMESVKAQVVADRSALSLGEVNIEIDKVFREAVRLRNISDQPVVGRLILAENSAGLILENPQDLSLAPGESKDVSVRFHLNVSQVKESAAELDGLLKLTVKDQEIHRIPVLALVKKISKIRSENLKVSASSESSAAGALTEMTLSNKGVHSGVALPFNLLGVDSRKKDPHHDPFMSRSCDLQAVGYRIVEKTVNEQKIKVLQVGIKTYDPMTTWNTCELSVLVDSNGDQKPDQELAAVQLGNIKGLSTPLNEMEFASVLLDAGKTRDLRAKYELAAAATKPGTPAPEENYQDAVMDLLPLSTFNHSTVLMVEADITKLARRDQGALAIKVATIFNDSSAVEMDDFLGNEARKWQKISLEEQSQSFVHLPESLSLQAGQKLTAEFDKGQGQGSLLVLYPDNRTVVSDVETDDQMQILKPAYGN